MEKNGINRRNFIRNTSSALAGISMGVPSFSIIPEAKTNSPNDKIVLGLIGGRNQGFYDLKDGLRQKNVVCGGICDIDEEILNKRVKEVEEIQGKAPEKFSDFRDLLKKKDIDAVVIGVPDHWHCLMLTYACMAGKDAYVEKPLANSITECDLMVKAVRRYHRVVQVGMQQESGHIWKHTRDLVKNGKIGRLRKVLLWANFDYGIGDLKAPDSAPPKGVDFNMWLGPAPLRKFNPSRFHRYWRMFWDYGGGLMTDWGVHLMDMALWIKEVKSLPRSVISSGGKWAFPDHDHETFDTMAVNYQMDDYVITWQSTAGIQTGPYDSAYGVKYIGDLGSIVANRGWWQLIPERENGKDKIEAIPKQKRTDDPHLQHLKNFIDCIRSREDPVCPIENGSLVAKYTHMGNLSLRTRGALLQWDHVKNRFSDNDEANDLLTPFYRKPWNLPQI